MEDINTIYFNNYGIAFQWKRCAAKDLKKIQIVFRNTGLFLTETELIKFSKNIEETLESSCLCNDCKKSGNCKLFLLQAPNPQASFSMSQAELKNMQDLLSGTLFQLGLDKILKDNIIDS